MRLSNDSICWFLIHITCSYLVLNSSIASLAFNNLCSLVDSLGRVSLVYQRFKLGSWVYRTIILILKLIQHSLLLARRKGIMRSFFVSVSNRLTQDLASRFLWIVNSFWLLLWDLRLPWVLLLVNFDGLFKESYFILFLLIKGCRFIQFIFINEWLISLISLNCVIIGCELCLFKLSSFKHKN